jgi:hypothetical protein
MSKSNIAKYFWSVNSHDELAELLFPRIHKGVSMAPNNNVAISSNSAKKWYKGSLEHVLYITQNTSTDPKILAKFAKDTRVSVRRNLMANPSTPDAVRMDLARWAFLKNDQIALDSACAVMNLEDLTSVLSEYANSYNNEYNRVAYITLKAWPLAERLATRPDLAMTAASCAHTQLNACLASLANSGSIKGVSVSAIIEAHPAHLGARDVILKYVLDERELLSCDLSNSWIKHHPTDAGEDFGHRTTKFTSVEPGAADILVDGNPAQFLSAIMAGADPEKIQKVLLTGSLEHLSAALQSMRIAPMTAACEKAFVVRFIQFALAGETEEDAYSCLPSYKTVSVYEILSNLTHKLESALLLELLQVGSSTSTIYWIQNSENMVNGLRPGIVASLLADPKDTLKYFLRYSNTPTAEIAVLNVLIEACEKFDWLFEEILPFYDLEIGTSLSDSSVAQAVFPYLVKRLGFSNSQAPNMIIAWESYFSFADNWTGTLTLLLDTIDGLTQADARIIPEALEDLQLALY